MARIRDHLMAEALIESLPFPRRFDGDNAIVSDDKGLLPPCGACRQVLSEFNPDLQLILTSATGDVKVTSLGKLFPMPADLKKLAKRPPK